MVSLGRHGWSTVLGLEMPDWLACRVRILGLWLTSIFFFCLTQTHLDSAAMTERLNVNVPNNWIPPINIVQALVKWSSSWRAPVTECCTSYSRFQSSHWRTDDTYLSCVKLVYLCTAAYIHWLFEFFNMPAVSGSQNLMVITHPLTFVSHGFTASCMEMFKMTAVSLNLSA